MTTKILLARIESVDSKIMNEAMPASINRFKKDEI